MVKSSVALATTRYGRSRAKPTAVSDVLLPSVGAMVFVSLLFVLAFNSGQGLLADGDTGYHIRTGELILRTWQVPTHDPYSFHYPALEWTAHEWLSEIIMAVVFNQFGLTGIVLLFALVLAVTHWLLYRFLRQKSNDILLCTAVTLLATASSSIHWLARPHVFSLLFTVTWCHCLDRFQERNDRSLVYLPPMMLLWVNLHGGFVFGLIFMTIYLGGNLLYALTSRQEQAEVHARKAKKLFIALLAAIGVCLINPHGAEIFLFPFRMASDRFVMDRVTEFLSPNFHEPLPFKYMLLATIGVLAVSKRTVTLVELGLLLLLSSMALYSARHISLFALVIAPILLRNGESLVNRLPDRILAAYRTRIRNLTEVDCKLKGYVWPLASVLLITGLAATGILQYRFSDKRFPVNAVEFLKQEPIMGNMFNNDEFGDYLIFAAWPAYRVFIDGRSDMYGERYGSAYFQVAQAQRGWKEILAKYDITWVFFDTESPLTSALLEQKDWQPVYSDEVATIFVKKIQTHEALLAKYTDVTPPK